MQSVHLSGQPLDLVPHVQTAIYRVSEVGGGLCGPERWVAMTDLV